MEEFFSQLRGHLTSRLRIIGVLSASILLGITGPFGTFLSLTIWERMAYWGSIVIVSVLAVQVVKVVIDMRFMHLGQLTKGLIVASVLTILLAPGLNFLTDWVLDEKSMYDTPLWVFAALTFSLTCLVVGLQYLVGIKTFKDGPRIYARFSDPKASGILWMTVRDHYVDVYTNRGKETLLMRFSDAMAELDGMAGLQVHRSHWVASCAVSSLRKENGRNFVVLQDGTEVPVSRGYLDAANAKFG